jgi:hypothetical protein
LRPVKRTVQVAGEGGSPALLEDEAVQRLDRAVCLRATGADEGVPDAEPGQRRAEVGGAKVAPVIGEHALQTPAGRGELGADTARELRGLRAAAVALGAGDELRPGVRGGDVDRGQLPDRALRTLQPPDEEAIPAHQLARPLRLHVPLRLGLSRRLVGRCEAGDEREPLLPRLRPCRRRQRQTPLCETTIPPQRSRRSSLAIRHGP